MNKLIEAKRPGFDRRKFLANCFLLSAVSFLRLSHAQAAEAPPETNRVRFVRSAAICLAPQYVAEEFLHQEGFSHVEYVERGEEPIIPSTLLAGRADLAITTVPEALSVIDQDLPLVILAGLHAGCWELFGHEDIRSVKSLKGKSIAIRGAGTTEHIFISSVLAYVGIDPRKDIRWVTAHTIPETMQLFIERKADAFLGFPPQPQELRAKRVGRVILNTAEDRPWSQYFCCMVTANKKFVQAHPVATKRALRALLKATDVCAQDPQRVARYLGAKGYEVRYPLAMEVLEGIRYDRWRETNPDDTLRFHALRLLEVGLVKSSPQKLIAQGTDWRFLDELKRELKA